MKMKISAACCFANCSAAASPKTVTYRSSHIWELLSRKAAQGERVVVLVREENRTGIAAASVTVLYTRSARVAARADRDQAPRTARETRSEERRVGKECRS